MKIYIITKGEYSDYHIVTTFNDKRTAEDFVNLMNKRFSDYSEKYEIEEYDILEKIDDYKPDDVFLDISYDSRDKKIAFSTQWYDSSYKRKIYFYKEGFFIASLMVKLTAKNVIEYEKIMKDWIVQIEYELQNIFNGDLKLFEKHWKEKNNEQN